MVRIKPSSRITTPLPARSVPSTDAENASSGISERSDTTALSTGPRSKRKPLRGGCSSEGKAQSVDSAMDAVARLVENAKSILRQFARCAGLPRAYRYLLHVRTEFLQVNQRSADSCRPGPDRCLEFGWRRASRRCKRHVRNRLDRERKVLMISKAIVAGASRKWVGLVAFASFVAVSGQAWAQGEQQELVNSAETTFSNFMRDPDMTWFQRHIGSAKAVLIAPQIVKAGWIFGGSGGRAVLFARSDQTGRWEGPAFYNLATASVGFQAGVAVSETVTLVMTDRGLNSLLATSVKVGGDASIAAGPIGAGANADVTTDFVAFARSKGVYGGLNLDGTVIHVADNWNRAYYGRDIQPPDILVRASAHNPQADRLVAALNRASSAKTSLR